MGPKKYPGSPQRKYKDSTLSSGTCFTNAAIDPADNTTHLTGRRIDFIFTTGLLHGITTQTSPAWWTSGLIFTEDENRTYQCYMERDQAALLKSPTDDIDAGDKFPFETAYPLVLADITAGEGFASDYLDGALMLPRNKSLSNRFMSAGVRDKLCKRRKYSVHLRQSLLIPLK